MTCGCKASISDSDPRADEPSLTDWAYLAGIIDGEGSIGLHRDGRHNRMMPGPRLSIVNTDRKFFDWFIAKFALRTRNLPFRQTKSHLGKRPVYRFKTCSRSEILRLLSGTLPFLIIKREQAESLLEFLHLAERRKRPDHHRDLKGRFMPGGRCPSSLPPRIMELVQSLRKRP